LPKALPFSLATWHPTPVFVRTHDVTRMGEMVRWKYVDSAGSFFVQADGASAEHAVRTRRDFAKVLKTRPRL
jgi:hypothetical protein